MKKLARSRTILAAFVVAACGRSDAPPPSPSASPSATAPVPEDVPVPPIPRLAPDREAFWSRFIGESPGAPGPDALAWCRQAVADGERPKRVIAPDVVLLREKQQCALQAWGLSEDPSRALVKEMHTALARWRRRNGTTSWIDGRHAETWVDTKNQLTAKVNARDIANNPISIWWHPYVPVESIIGTDRRLLRDLDVEALVGKPADALGRAVKPPFELEQSPFCDERSCSADGPSPPGGDRVSVSLGDHGRGERGLVVVDIKAPDEDRERLLALIQRSLGVAEKQPNNDLVITVQGEHGKFRYQIRLLRGSTLIMIEKLE